MATQQPYAAQSKVNWKDAILLGAITLVWLAVSGVALLPQ